MSRPVWISVTELHRAPQSFNSIPLEMCVSDPSFPTIKIAFAELVKKSNLERSAIVSSITRGSPMRTKVTRLRSCDSFVAPACRPLLVAPAFKNIQNYLKWEIQQDKRQNFLSFFFHFHERFREITSYQCLTKHHILHSPHRAEVTCDWRHVWEIRHSVRERRRRRSREPIENVHKSRRSRQTRGNCFPVVFSSFSQKSNKNNFTFYGIKLFDRRRDGEIRGIGGGESLTEGCVDEWREEIDFPPSEGCMSKFVWWWGLLLSWKRNDFA